MKAETQNIFGVRIYSEPADLHVPGTTLNLAYHSDRCGSPGQTFAASRDQMIRLEDQAEMRPIQCFGPAK